MPKYTVLERSLIGNEIHEVGAVVEYDGLPAENLAPMDDAGHAKYQEYLASNKARVEKMQAENASVDEDALSRAIAKAQSGQAALIADAVAQAIAKVFPNGTAKKAADPAAPVESIA